MSEPDEKVAVEETEGTTRKGNPKTLIQMTINDTIGVQSNS